MELSANDRAKAAAIKRGVMLIAAGLVLTLAIVWGAVRLAHEGPPVELVAGRWVLSEATSCTGDSVLMEVEGRTASLHARDASLEGRIVWVARVAGELRLDLEPANLPGSVYSLGFRRLTPDRLALVSAGFLVPPLPGAGESGAKSGGERFHRFGMASLGLVVRRCSGS